MRSQEMSGNTFNPAASPGSLRHSSHSSLRIRRLNQGRGFVYKRSNDRAIRDQRVLTRIQRLAIPLAWSEVFICDRTDGHVQATGRDARGRKQYIYHPKWRHIRDRLKYARLVAFARVLPRIRRRVQRDIRKPGLTKSKALAAIVRLLEIGRIRVGNEEYARTNRSFGLTTFRNRHVSIRGEKLHFQFRGKSGKHHSVELVDRRLARVVDRCRKTPGPELFQYLDEKREPRSINSADVNEYLREITGGDFTAKDFRTWAGTVLASKALHARRHCDSRSQTRRQLNLAIRIVAERLGNTPAICRKSYIHPMVIDTYLSGRRVRPARIGSRQSRRQYPRGLSVAETEVLRLLQTHPAPKT